jgi:hypothetical protein
MSDVNRAMRLNKYHENEYFTPHKDAQYVPSGNYGPFNSYIDLLRIKRSTQLSLILTFGPPSVSKKVLSTKCFSSKSIYTL